MTDIAYSRRNGASEKTTLTVILAIAKTVAEVIRTWRHNYRSRRELAMYSHDARSDLGYAVDIDAEIAKPFWMK